MKKIQSYNLISKLRYLPVASLLIISLHTQVSAQSIVAATMPDQIVAPNGFPNSASIDYSLNSIPPNPQLTAVVEDPWPSPGAPMLWVTDNVYGWILVPLPLPPGTFPDVVIGNDITNPLNYTIGVSANVGGNAELIMFTISGEGTPFFTFTPGPIYTISTSPTVTGPVRVDIEAQYSNLSLLLPLCDNFAMTWTDASGIEGYFGQLSNPTSGTPTLIQGGTTLSSPDVALVERYNSVLNIFENWALFAYIDNTVNPSYLYYQEWNTANPIPSPVILWDNANYFYTFPISGDGVRISAIDDYSINGGFTGLYPAYFDIVVASPNPAIPGNVRIFEYNNLLGPFNPYDITTGITGPPAPGVSVNKNVTPVVTCGPGPYYAIGYFSAGISNEGCYATPIDWYTGAPSSTNTFAINHNPLTAATSGGVTLAGTCNNEYLGQQQLFAAWENSPSLDYKYTITSPYTFRQAQPQQTSAVQTQDWQLFPNPAYDEVSITAPQGFSANDATTYRITDLTGRNVQQGAITNATQQLQVNGLPQGMYLVNIYNLSGKVTTLKFVKD